MATFVILLGGAAVLAGVKLVDTNPPQLTGPKPFTVEHLEDSERSTPVDGRSDFAS